MLARRSALLVVLAVASLVACEKKKPQTETPPPRPNVVFITVDTLRADRLGCYGFAEAHTPHIDRLAAEGVRAERAIAATPITLPSHATLFTGLYPPAHGIRDNGRQRLPDEVETLAERLKKQGYRTQAFVSAMVLHRRFNLNQGFDGYDDDLRREDESMMFMVEERRGDRTTDHALEWLGTTSADEPFFLWVHLFDPHQPYEPPARDAKLAATAYDGEITSADRQVGRLVDDLKERRLLDDTILVFTSDHGESLGEHGEATHGLFIYESTQHVPLIVRYPRRLPAGKTYDGFVRGVDLMPTVLGLAALDPGKTQGVDLSEALAGTTDAPTLAPYSESLHGKYEFAMAPLFGVRSGRWTYIRAPRPELYDRAADPEEKHNLLEVSGPKAETADDEAETLDRMLTGILERSDRFGFVAEPNPLDEETVAMLQALGYMEASDAPQGVDGMDPKDGVRAFDELDRARAFIRAGDYEGAKKVLAALLEWIPTNATAHNLLALCELRTNDAPGAKKRYLQSLAIEPRQPQVLRQLGRIALAGGDTTSARNRFREALNVDPTDVEAMVLMAHLDLETGASDEAARWYDRAIEADPGYVEPYLQYGNLYFRQGDFDKARGWYEKALQADPESFAAATQVGLSALQTGDLDGAARHFIEASRLEPGAWQPDFSLACVRARQGNESAARALLERARHKGFDKPALLESKCFRELVD